MTRGGKRDGAGRPTGSTKKNKKASYATRLRPDQIRWLKRQKNAAFQIESALDLWINKDSL
jgi:hypothetical protein